MNKTNIEIIWSHLIKSLESDFTNTSIYENCIKPSKIIKISNDEINILVPSIFAKSIWSNDYYEKTVNFFMNQLNKRYKFLFLLNEEKPISNLNDELLNKGNFLNNNSYDSGLNPEYTLENFVVGEFNKSAYNAICAISKNMGKIYNPLFIYGSTGLGKTHLISGLGNLYLKQFQNKKVKYIDTNDFSREVFSALSKGGNFVEELKKEYSSYDLLLIDDIQYLAGKDKTNEIFFNIFNNLVKQNHQIIITSDKNPENLDSLEERMVSRFSSGLTIKIERPELDALKRIVIEKLKSQDSSFVFQDDAIAEIVKYYNNDLRKLIGILNKISFYAIQNLQPNEIITKEFVSRFISETRTLVLSCGDDFNPELIISIICRWYGVKEEGVRGVSRLKELTTVRHVCMYVLRTKYNMGLNEIGALFSNRDHTTVMSAINKVEKMIAKDEQLREYINNSLNKI